METSDQRRTVLRAVRAVDVGGLLGLTDGGASQCVVCGRAIASTDDIGGFIKLGGVPRLFCARPDCLEAVQSGRPIEPDGQATADG
jgi:hypothetical protein